MENAEFRIFVDEVKAATDIVKIIGSRIQLTRLIMAKCPFHDDENPSLSVNPDGQYFYCFGCGAGGDVIEFLKLLENKPFKEVLAKLAAEAGITPPWKRNQR